MATKIKSAEMLAKQLLVVRSRKNRYETLDKKLTASFREALAREQLNQAGEYQMVPTTTFMVVDENLAKEFALERGLVKVDVARVHEVFRLDPELRFKTPEQYGFEEVTQVKISPIRGRYQQE